MRISDWSSDVCSSDLPVDIEAINRQITHVAAGTEDTDAVNLAQLNEVADGAAETGKYFQASGSDDSDAGAYVEGDNAVAAGEEIGRASCRERVCQYG